MSASGLYVVWSVGKDPYYAVVATDYKKLFRVFLYHGSSKSGRAYWSGDATSLEEAKKLAYHMMPKMPRALFNPSMSLWEPLRGGWWRRRMTPAITLIAYYQRIYDPRGMSPESYHWRVMQGTRAIMYGDAPSLAKVKSYAEDAYRQWMARKPRTLFNARTFPARWWVGQREDGTWELQKARSAMRFPWVNIVGPFALKAEAVKEMSRRNYKRKKPRTLFNSPFYHGGWMVSSRGKRKNWANWGKVIGNVRGSVFHDKEAGTFDVTVWKGAKKFLSESNLSGSLREMFELADASMKRAVEGYRTLFNPTQEMMPHGKIVIEQLTDKRRTPPKAYRWMVYLATTFTHGEHAGQHGFWGPAASGIRLRRAKAREDAKKAYSRLTRTKPRMLFNVGAR